MWGLHAQGVTTTEIMLSADNPTDRSYHYELAIADAAEVRAAQRLRYQVFAVEQGATTQGPDGLDIDGFDDHCEHLIVRHVPDGGHGEVVGTYRMLPPHARRGGSSAFGLYSGTEFDLRPLAAVLGSTVEVGRSCVAANHRNGTVVSLLWRGIGRYLQLTGHRYLLGCASVDVADGGANAAAVWAKLRDGHLVDTALRCRPLRPLPLGRIEPAAAAAPPPLLTGYLRLGARVCGPPCLDAAFGTADFLVLLDLESADPRYLRFFLAGGR